MTLINARSAVNMFVTASGVGDKSIILYLIPLILRFFHYSQPFFLLLAISRVVIHSFDMFSTHFSFNLSVFVLHSPRFVWNAIVFSVPDRGAYRLSIQKMKSKS